MIYILFAIAAFMAIITAFITNSIAKTGNKQTLKKVIVIAVSIVLYIIIAVYILQQKVS